MRIISGKYRGKVLKEFELNSTKPTLDRVREAIFDSVQFEIRKAKVLDLFSGTGAMGIEAISREAELVVMIDNNKKAIDIIKKNLFGVDGNYKVYFEDAVNFLKNTNDQFDIIFLDPPYNSDYYVKCINEILSRNLLLPNGKLIIEKSIENKLTFDTTKFNIKTKHYGKVEVLICTKD